MSCLSWKGKLCFLRLPFVGDDALCADGGSIEEPDPLCAVVSCRSSSSSRARFLPLSFIGNPRSDECCALSNVIGSVEESDAAVDRVNRGAVRSGRLGSSSGGIEEPEALVDRVTRRVARSEKLGSGGEPDPLCAVVSCRSSSSPRGHFLPLSFIGDPCSDERGAVGNGTGSVEEPDAAAD